MKRAIELSAVFLCLILAACGRAGATNVMQISWDSYGAGNMGNFDLDLTVNNGLSGPFSPYNATYGVHSTTNSDSGGFFNVANRLGFVLTNNTPQFVRDQGAGSGGLNAATSIPSGTTGAPFTQEGRWAHETASLAYDPSTKMWISVWETLVKSHPFSGLSDPYYIAPTGVCGDTATTQTFGKNFPEYGWIALTTLSNTSDTQPNPDMTTLASKETRLFVGSAYNNALVTNSSSWATGTPSNPISVMSYAAFSEPGLYYDSGSSTLYMAMSGNYCVSNVLYSDVVLMKSTNDGSSWTYVSKLLSPTDANNIDSTWNSFTGSSIHKDPSTGTVRLDVTGVEASTGFYKGIVEFEFNSLSSGTLVTIGGNPAVQGYEAKQTGIFSGAGTFNLSTGKHIEDQACSSSCGSIIFDEWELSW